MGSVVTCRHTIWRHWIYARAFIQIRQHFAQCLPRRSTNRLLQCRLHADFRSHYVSNVLNTALYPSLARQAVTDPGTLPAIYERMLRYLMVLALPIAMGGWALADQIIPFLLTRLQTCRADHANHDLGRAADVCFGISRLYCCDRRSRVTGRPFYRCQHNTECGTEYSFDSWLWHSGSRNYDRLDRGRSCCPICTWILHNQLRVMRCDRALLRPFVAASMICGLALVLHNRLSLIPLVCVSALVYTGLLLLLGVLGRDKLDL